MPLIDAPQGTPEWRAARLGKVTASRIADLTAKTKTGPSASRANYMAELALERLTGEPMEKFQSAAMLNGSLREPEARERYELQTGCMVYETGFWLHPTISDAGASPDGLIDEDGGLEIKCPEPKAHMETLLSGTVSDPYFKQCQWNMACTGRAWWHYTSFNPAFPEKMRLCIIPLKRDLRLIEDLEGQVRAFLAELADKVEELRKRYG